MVEIYFWSCGMIPEEEFSRARLMFAKTFGLVSILDDTYDVHATAEECLSLTQAMQRCEHPFDTYYEKFSLRNCKRALTVQI
jgi:hypothetical protein